jgi:hypothetical protein
MHFDPRQCTRCNCGADLEPTTVTCTTCRNSIHSARQRLFRHLSVHFRTTTYYLFTWITLLLVHAFQPLVLKLLVTNILRFRKFNVAKSCLILSSFLSYYLHPFFSPSAPFLVPFFFHFFADGPLGSIILETLVYIHCRTLLSVVISGKFYFDNRFSSEYSCFSLLILIPFVL